MRSTRESFYEYTCNLLIQCQLILISFFLFFFLFFAFFPSSTAVRFGRVPKREKAKILAAMQSKNQSNQDKLLTEQLMDEQAMLNAIFKAHNETCDFTHVKMAPIFLKAEQNPIFADYPSQMVSMV